MYKDWPFKRFRTKLRLAYPCVLKISPRWSSEILISCVFLCLATIEHLLCLRNSRQRWTLALCELRPSFSQARLKLCHKVKILHLQSPTQHFYVCPIVRLFFETHPLLIDPMCCYSFSWRTILGGCSWLYTSWTICTTSELTLWNLHGASDFISVFSTLSRTARSLRQPLVYSSF